VYIPLGGSRLGFGRELGNIMTTFVLSGLWHGASWNYVLWGAYHGVLLVASRLSARVVPAPPPSALRWLAPLRIVGTFVLVHVGWLIFRETDTAILLRHFAASPWADSALDRQAALSLVLMLLPFAAPLALEGVWVEWHRGRAAAPADEDAGFRLPAVALQGVFVGLVFTSILLFRSRASLDFIYFQF
jgi:D-alanyl-lipoteichoic acid acyltransferase DltB (MBOAT superfamily)